VTRQSEKRTLLALKRAIEATFDESDWIELGLVTGSSEHLDSHPRLYRSLYFGDEDYANCIVDVLPMILGRDQENLNDVLDLVGLGAWLREHDPELYNQLQGASLTLSSDDLSALHDPDAIYTHLRRLRASVDTDPEHAVGVAKELVESTVKLVLLQLDVEFDNSDDLPRLAKQAQRALLLHAGTISPDSKGADATKKVLNGLTQIAVGIAELRNHYGTGHGRTASATGLKPRHAQMAVDAATAYCRALLTTLADQSAPWNTRPSE
jgi:hypothetical protein